MANVPSPSIDWKRTPWLRVDQRPISIPSSTPDSTTTVITDRVAYTKTPAPTNTSHSYFEMDHYSATPVRQVGSLTTPARHSNGTLTTPGRQMTTPIKTLRTPLTRTTSSPALHLYTPVAMTRRDSTSSFASSIDSSCYPITPHYVAPEMIQRTYSNQGGRPRSSTTGSFHPYYPTQMARRHTHMGGGEEMSQLTQWATTTPQYCDPIIYDDTLDSYSAAMSYSAATSALQSGTSTPMQHTLSSPLSEISANRDVLPLIVSSMDKAHVCPQCNRRFKRLEHVKRHERSHTLEKPFTCSFDGCGRHFSRSDNLKAHEKTHFKNGRNYRAMEKKRLSQQSSNLDTPTNNHTLEPTDASLFDSFVGVSAFIDDDDFSEFTVAI